MSCGVCHVGVWGVPYKANNDASTRAIDSLINNEVVKYLNNEAFKVEKYDELLKRHEDVASGPCVA